MTPLLIPILATAALVLAIGAGFSITLLWLFERDQDAREEAIRKEISK